MKSILKTRTLLLSALVLAVFLISAIPTDAQNSRRNRRTTAKTDLKKGAEDVAIQIKNITKFVFVLGGVANGIEEIDKEIREGRASREVERKNAEFKAKVRASVRGIRAGIVRLEVDFRAKPALRKYLANIKGVSDQSAKAEDLALAGQFNDCGKELLLVVETLADTLVAMP